MQKPEVMVLATRNTHKIREMQDVLADTGIQLKSSLDFAELQDVVEDGDTLHANALKKARYTFQATGMPSLADDTGLEVEALGGAPGGVFRAICRRKCHVCPKRRTPPV